MSSPTAPLTGEHSAAFVSVAAHVCCVTFNAPPGLDLSAALWAVALPSAGESMQQCPVLCSTYASAQYVYAHAVQQPPLLSLICTLSCINMHTVIIKRLLQCACGCLWLLQAATAAHDQGPDLLHGLSCGLPHGQRVGAWSSHSSKRVWIGSMGSVPAWARMLWPQLS